MSGRTPETLGELAAAWRRDPERQEALGELERILITLPERLARGFRHQREIERALHVFGHGVRDEEQLRWAITYELDLRL